LGGGGGDGALPQRVHTAHKQEEDWRREGREGGHGKPGGGGGGGGGGAGREGEYAKRHSTCGSSLAHTHPPTSPNGGWTRGRRTVSWPNGLPPAEEGAGGAGRAGRGGGCDGWEFSDDYAAAAVVRLDELRGGGGGSEGEEAGIDKFVFVLRCRLLPLLYYGFTAALLRLYYCFTAAVLRLH
jgi:hypothetical protein